MERQRLSLIRDISMDPMLHFPPFLKKLTKTVPPFSRIEHPSGFTCALSEHAKRILLHLHCQVVAMRPISSMPLLLFPVDFAVAFSHSGSGSKLWFWFWLRFGLGLGFGQQRRVIQPRSTDNGQDNLYTHNHVAVSTGSPSTCHARIDNPVRRPLASDYTILPDAI